LDLGPAVEGHLRVFSPFARQIRFAGLLPVPPRGADLDAALEALPAHAGHPYDVVLTWDLLDRLRPEERPTLIRRLDELTGPGARLYAAVDASEGSTIQPLRFSLLGRERLCQQAVGPPEKAPVRLLPAQVERLLLPFEVIHAFTVRMGYREYVAVKGGVADSVPPWPKDTPGSRRSRPRP
jgi:hypothetical protein